MTYSYRTAILRPDIPLLARVPGLRIDLVVACYERITGHILRYSHLVVKPHEQTLACAVVPGDNISLYMTSTLGVVSPRESQARVPLLRTDTLMIVYRPRPILFLYGILPEVVRFEAG